MCCSSGALALSSLSATEAMNCSAIPFSVAGLGPKAHSSTKQCLLFPTSLVPAGMPASLKTLRPPSLSPRQIIKIINDMPPQAVCQSVGLCSAAGERPASRCARISPCAVDATHCPFCQHAAQTLEAPVPARHCSTFGGPDGVTHD